MPQQLIVNLMLENWDDGSTSVVAESKLQDIPQKKLTKPLSPERK
jgi:hypothetical protein